MTSAQLNKNAFQNKTNAQKMKLMSNQNSITGHVLLIGIRLLPG
jgi:hypothetical protein